MECSPYVLAASLLANLHANLGDARGGVTERCAVYPHTEPAIEWCSMSWVGVGTIRPAQPARGGGVLVWTLDLTIGVQRCYPVDPHGDAPSEAAVDSAARDVLDDGEAMRRAVVSAFEDADIEYVVTGWRPIPPQGGAHGSRMDVQVPVSWGAYVEPRSPMLPGDPRA
ncbi:hypothetical protein [Gordonia sp. (in: high G+C Gram-positive bacteria)]|uniref:hypothetical protein n=1 Tax=Gordonia sp. (in: high G+C Gram-positive bacteria) TaxID=84139 RepID=UPI002631DB87|nr:hypothetical protein [Gordonia sp. (in: high G+C Gram-positive bacteria)]